MTTITPIATVHNQHTTMHADQWAGMESVIELLPPMQDSSLDGIEDFSHVEVIFLFDRVAESEIETGTRHPRGNPDWPLVGILAQRGKDRPNRLGASIVRILGREGRRLRVLGLDALDGSPVIDIKPVLREFLPAETLRQPTWAMELMSKYWEGNKPTGGRDYLSAEPAAYQRLPEHTRDEAWIRQFLRNGTVAHVSHLSGDQPFVTPRIYWYDEPNQRIIIHGNIRGRLPSNLSQNSKISVEVSEFGRFLPANTALEFGLQYRSVMVFGVATLLESDEEKKAALYGLLNKYFPNMTPGKEYRPITDGELKRTSVYSLTIESCTGKENWKEQADQSDDWPPLEASQL